MSNKCCSGDREEGKTTEVVEDREVKKSYVKGCVWQSMWKMVCYKRKMVRVTVVWKRGCDKVVWKMRKESSMYCLETNKAQRTVLRPTRPSPALLHEANERHHCAMQSALLQSPHARVDRSDQTSENSSSQDASNHFLGNDIMNDSFANYQIIHEAILRSTRECHKHCHQNSEHDNRNETSHIASTHALKVVTTLLQYAAVSSPNRKDLTTLHGRSYCALLAGEDIFSQQQMVLHTLRQTFDAPYSKTCTITFQAETYLARKESQWRSWEQRRFIARDIQPVSGSNASDIQYQESGLPKHGQNIEQLWQQRKWSIKNLSAWLARCPWAPASWASAWQQRKTIQNRQWVKSWQAHCAKPAVTGATITKDETGTWPEKNKTCQHCFQNVNVPASLLDRFAQTCTRPLPTLGQSVKHAYHANIASRM